MPMLSMPASPVISTPSLHGEFLREWGSGYFPLLSFNFSKGTLWTSPAAQGVAHHSVNGMSTCLGLILLFISIGQILRSNCISLCLCFSYQSELDIPKTIQHFSQNNDSFWIKKKISPRTLNHCLWKLSSIHTGPLICDMCTSVLGPDPTNL